MKVDIVGGYVMFQDLTPEETNIVFDICNKCKDNYNGKVASRGSTIVLDDEASTFWMVMQKLCNHIVINMEGKK